MGELHKLPQKQDCCGCSAFEQACSVLSPYEVCTPQKTFACIILRDDMLLQSSSGGIFTLLAEKVCALCQIAGLRHFLGRSRPYYENPQRAYLFRHYKTQMNSVFENTQSK